MAAVGLRGVLRGRHGAGSLVATAALVAIGACSPSALVDLTPVSPTPTEVHNIGQFVWSDLVTDDMAAAKRFYSDSPLRRSAPTHFRP